jgi:phosphohistidine phosphatase
MKQLIVLRHAKAAPQDEAGDHKRPLADKGRKAMPLVGAKLKELGVKPEIILVSTAARTRETYDLAAGPAGFAGAEFEDEIYLASTQVLLRRLKKIPPRTNSVLIIGHNPGLADMIRRLSDPAESDADALRRARLKVPPGAFAVMDVLTPWSEMQDGDCGLKAFFTPADLGAGADEE